MAGPSSDPLAAIKVTFFQECEEQLAELESGLLALEAGEADPDTVNAVFRAVHSIKGGAGAFSLEELVRFAHVFETAMDRLRSGDLAPEPDILKVMLLSADVLADHVRAARDGGSVDEGRTAAMAAALAGLGLTSAAAPALSEPAVEDDGFGDFEFTPMALDIGDSDGGAALDGEPAAAAETRPWVVKFYPQAALYAKANEAGLLLRELERLGECRVAMDSSGLPNLDRLNAEDAYLGWTVSVSGEVAEAQIREVFEFVEGDCYLDVRRDGELSAADAATAEVCEEKLAEASPAAATVDVQALIKKAQEAVVPNAGAAPALTPTPQTAKTEPAAGGGGAAVGQTIRVDLERVDRLIDLVGELVINQAMLTQRVAECGLARASAVAVGLDDLEQLTREIQDSVMAIRAQPVKSVFQRMPRLVREIAAMTGKQVRLITEGEGTEVDKTVIERLSDPLTHMIRNAIDHGLEKPEERIAAGKPAEGVVRLQALHRSGRIVIEVTDDGRGINRKKVREIAVNKGLISPEQQLSDDEIDNLIFMPGFSTADQVSDISGRGVGMDVVRRSIQALGGRINISSRPGLGSTFTMSLPLTLAVLDGMVVTCPVRPWWRRSQPSSKACSRARLMSAAWGRQPRSSPSATATCRSSISDNVSAIAPVRRRPRIASLFWWKARAGRAPRFWWTPSRASAKW
jgi:two-component system chemotaxis sensor kinase CheA